MYVKALSLGLGALPAALAAALLLAEPAAAQGRWELLGTRSVGFHVDRDVVGGRGQGRFQVIRICVANNAVQFRDVTVEFANGERQELPVNAFVRPGQCTANLDLRGDARRIDRVTMIYNTVPNFRGRATVAVYGLHPATGVAPGRWDVIGRRNVSFHVERDTIGGRGEGRFRAIRLCVARNGVHFREVEIVFRNGEERQVPVQRFIGPGQCTPAFDLPGETRSIREVHMVYNTVPNFRGQAAVTLFGLR
jgi:hypothetical protein